MEKTLSSVVLFPFNSCHASVANSSDPRGRLIGNRSNSAFEAFNRGRRRAGFPARGADFAPQNRIHLRQKSFGICAMHHRPIAASRAIISARAHPVCPRSSNLKPRLAAGFFFPIGPNPPPPPASPPRKPVFRLEPIGRAARAVKRVLPPRHDALKAHLASVGKHGWPVLLDALYQHADERGLLARPWGWCVCQKPA